MDKSFEAYIESLHPAFENLMRAAPVTILSCPKWIPSEAIYLLSEGDRHLYCGRTRKLRQRMRNHSAPSSKHNQAVFAFRLAREETGNLLSSYSGPGTRLALMSNPSFFDAFKRAKQRIQTMDLRYVAESDPTRQALLELYVSIALQTPYNDFNTH